MGAEKLAKMAGDLPVVQVMLPWEKARLARTAQEPAWGSDLLGGLLEFTENLMLFWRLEGNLGGWDLTEIVAYICTSQNQSQCQEGRELYPVTR